MSFVYEKLYEERNIIFSDREARKLKSIKRSGFTLVHVNTFSVKRVEVPYTINKYDIK